MTDEQLAYLFQIKASKPSLADSTVRVMLSALRWTPEEIERALVFLKRPPSPSQPPSSKVFEPPTLVVLAKPINIKQNPFPIGTPGSPVTFGRKKNVEKDVVITKASVHHSLAGAIIGLVVFVVGLLAYAYLHG